MSAAIRKMIAEREAREAKTMAFLLELAEREGDSPFAVGLTGAEYAAYGQGHEEIP